MGGEEGRGPASGLPLPGSIYSLLPRQGCVKFDSCLRALKFSLYLPKEERYMGHRGVIFEFCLPRYPKLLVEWLRERRNEKMHSVCLHNNRGVWAESSLTYRERHSVSTQQVTEFHLNLSSLRSCHHDPGRGPAQAGLASAPAVRKRQRSPGAAHVRPPHRHRATQQAPKASLGQARASGHWATARRRSLLPRSFSIKSVPGPWHL